MAADTDVIRFREAVLRSTGLLIDETRVAGLADVLRRLTGGAGSCEGYLRRLETQPTRADLAAIASELTVPETSFFRNVDQLRALVEICLPARMRVQGSRRQLRLLSAGCASGEEAYTLAILTREHIREPCWEISIAAVDLNPAMLERAARARFSAWSLRDTPISVRQRWFRSEGRDYQLDETIASSVRFAEHNLVESTTTWPPESFDIVFCRNVIMYFSPEHAQAVIARLTGVLAPGGFLFLGHAETLRNLSTAYHLRHTHDTFYYQRKGPAEIETAAASSTTTSTTASAFAGPPIAEVVDRADSWIEAIQQASARIIELTTPAVATLPAAPPVYAATPRPDLSAALALLQRERFAEALALVHALPVGAAQDPDVMLLRAVLLVQGGELLAAETVCRELLAMEDHSAGAHYLTALCREAAGDRTRAVEHDQVAVYVDPTFAMARLHLGLLARKTGDPAAARRELAQALVLLRREDPSRLFLFGGGFTRETLLALCRTELIACGGSA